MSRQEELEDIVRESGSLVERLEMCHARIAAMCKEDRPPKMSIPVQWNDDDFFIGVTLTDAQKSVESDACPACGGIGSMKLFGVITLNCSTCHGTGKRR